MEFVKNKVQEIWGDQAFVSSQMDGVESQLVALEKVAASFSHFIIEHWVPAQAILIDLHNSTCPSCQRADAMAHNGGSTSKSIRSGRAIALPVPVRGTAWYSLATRGLVLGGGVGGGVGRMVHCNSYSDN